MACSHRPLIRSEIPDPKVIRSNRVHLGRQDLHLRESTGNRHRSLWRAEEIRQNDFALLHPVLLKYGYGLNDRIPCGHDGIHQQHLSPRNIIWEPRVDHSRLVRFRVALHQDLSYPNRATAVPQPLFHGLATANNRDATVSGTISEAFIGMSGGSYHFALGVGQLVQALLDYNTNQSVGVEFEIAPQGVPGMGQRLSLSLICGCTFHAFFSLVSYDGLQFLDLIGCWDDHEVCPVVCVGFDIVTGLWDTHFWFHGRVHHGAAGC